MSDVIIKLTDVKKIFQLFWEDLVVFENVNLEIKRDEIVLFYGPSGSGKTTLLNIITGLIEPTEGDVEICGLYYDQMNKQEKNDFRAENFGIVFQDNNLISTLTAEENLLFFQEMLGGIENSDEKRIENWLKKFGLENRRKSFPEQLSGGEKKRLGIIRALINNPHILVLDEPTGNLDDETRDQICEIIKDIFQKTDITIVISSHDPKLRNIASKIYKIEKKKVSLEIEFPERKKEDKIIYRPIKSIEKWEKIEIEEELERYDIFEEFFEQAIYEDKENYEKRNEKTK
ncbi:MAG: ABC transporter ATP-binding protein [Candidatus Heimdallarchaeum aukensis]|uniref:ABC transporter ATP-binding protein n=1 Tax=Candidatus Heimdallarchaeum aukensis TaxID=2876573 RepID=A0A9Y1FKJ2_9ARCH|nr:MAG: ABC transporter ATP-binding protein [Candidatus Heimdallarchaeum aukensis]